MAKEGTVVQCNRCLTIRNLSKALYCPTCECDSELERDAKVFRRHRAPVPNVDRSEREETGDNHPVARLVGR